MVYSTEGVSQTITAGTHRYEMGNILEISEDTNDIKIIGNYMPSNYDSSRVVDPDGVAPCVKENHGTVTAILETNIVINDRGFKDKTPQVNTDGICPTLRAETHGNLPKVISCAIRGRYNDEDKV